jgi:hypothetical protein
LSTSRAERSLLLSVFAAWLCACQLITGATERRMGPAEHGCQTSDECDSGSVCPSGICSSEPSDAAPGTACTREALENTAPDDCIKPMCQGGRVTLVPEDGEIPRSDGNSCTHDRCRFGRPHYEPAPELNGQAIPEQIDGDCQKHFCDGDGNVTSEADPTDLPDDGNPCTLDSCFGSTPYSPNVPHGTPCPDGTCRDNLCVAPCANGLTDGDETGIDCGGTTCPRCDEWQPCTRASDCAARVCTRCTGGACTTCESSCTMATCGTPPMDVDDACAVITLREGHVVEEQSSPSLCHATLPGLRPRVGDTIVVYDQGAQRQAVTVSGSNAGVGPVLWYGRCVGVLQTREQLVAEAKVTTGWVPGAEPVGNPALLGMSCADAALFKW